MENELWNLTAFLYLGSYDFVLFGGAAAALCQSPFPALPASPLLPADL